MAEKPADSLFYKPFGNLFPGIMASKQVKTGPAESPETPIPDSLMDSPFSDGGPSRQDKFEKFPWWFPMLVAIAAWAFYSIFTTQSYREAFEFIRAGIIITIRTTLLAYTFALILGLVAGMARLSKNILIKNIATLYVEIIRGIPILVLIFFIALVGVPTVIDWLKAFGDTLNGAGLSAIGSIFSGMNNEAVAMDSRAIIALSVTYGAFLAEIFRAGIQSIGIGQMEAARSLGMSFWQAMYYIILPQAIRNILPALGNDFVAMVKDSSLVSVLAVRDITQVARLYAGRTFRFREAYTTLAVMYLTMTVLLSLVVQFIEKRMRRSLEK